MKKSITAFVLMLLHTGYAKAQLQVSNPSFEKWDTTGNYKQPHSWYTLNALANFQLDESTNITNDAHSGKYAVELESIRSNNQDISGVLCTGPILDANFNPNFSKIKVAFTSRPSYFEFYYKAFPMKTDTTLMAMVITRWNKTLKKADTVALASKAFGDTVSNYTLAKLPFIYRDTIQPDSMFIIATASADPYHPVIGTRFIIDDIKLNYSSNGINELNENVFQVYPNPSQQIVNICFQKLFKGNMFLYDITGKIIFENSMYDSNYKLDVSQLKNGLYILLIKDDTGIVQSSKIIVEH